MRTVPLAADETTARTATGTTPWRPSTAALAALVGAIATALTCVRITAPSLWTDESATISASSRGLPELFAMAANVDAVHTVYYALVSPWIAMFGASEVVLRFPSALAVGLATAGTYVLGERISGRTLGLWAAGCLVLLPRVAWAGIEGRPFAFALAAAVWATVALVSALRTGGRVRWVGYGALLVLGVLLNLYVALLPLAHGVTVALVARDRSRPWVTTAGVAGLVLAPFAWLASSQSEQLGRQSLSTVDLLRNVVVNQWFLGQTPTIFSRTPGFEAPEVASRWWQPAAVLLAAVAVAVVTVAAVLWVRGRARGGAPRDVLAWAVPWLVVPSVAVAAWAVVSDTYSPRYLTYCSPAVALLLAAALLALARSWQRGLAVAALVACAVPVLASQRTEHAKSGTDWREAAAAVEGSCDEGDAVYFAPRAAPAGPVVRGTTRAVAVAYPRPFVGLVDVTLERTAVDTDDLVGRSRLLQASGDLLASVDTLCVVRRHDLPVDVRDADDAYLADEGWREASRWQGPLDEVIVLTHARSGAGGG